MTTGERAIVVFLVLYSVLAIICFTSAAIKFIKFIKNLKIKEKRNNFRLIKGEKDD